MIDLVRTNLVWLVIITISSLTLNANDNTLAYIDQYKTIVLNEMDRVGIPASIKMAQAILESGSGRSTLARQSNNHFGIKCGKEWNGAEVYRHDDDYKNGLLVRSCFRAYDDPEDSFIAHSDFLHVNRRYAPLFNLDIYDYKSWAKELRKAGYATDPNYSKKLIDLIEKYELYLLDIGVSTENKEPLIAENITSERTIPGQRQIINDRKEDKKPVIIAAAKPLKSVTGYRLNKGYYTFKQGDKMTDLAAHFKMSTRELYFRNRLAFGAQPRVGEKLSIKSYIHLKEIPDTRQNYPLQQVDNFLFEETITISSL